MSFDIKEVKEYVGKILRNSIFGQYFSVETEYSIIDCEHVILIKISLDNRSPYYSYRVRLSRSIDQEFANLVAKNELRKFIGDIVFKCFNEVEDDCTN